MPSLSRQSLGKAGEDLACRELERRGYAILERRYRIRRGEFDVIARDGETLVFVEVKARATSGYGSAAEAVTTHKRRQLCGLAEAYLARRDWGDRPCRFDVVTVVMGRGGQARVDVLVNAFGLEGWS